MRAALPVHDGGVLGTFVSLQGVKASLRCQLRITHQKMNIPGMLTQAESAIQNNREKLSPVCLANEISNHTSQIWGRGGRP